MKIEFDMDDNSILYDVMDGIFIALLKRQLRDSKEYLATSYNEVDKLMNQANIDACRVLLEYYTKKDDDACKEALEQPAQECKWCKSREVNFDD
jgi:hypothetical protein